MFEEVSGKPPLLWTTESRLVRLHTTFFFTEILSKSLMGALECVAIVWDSVRF